MKMTKEFAKLVDMAKTAGYALSTWKRHSNIKCPECGKVAAVFYCVADRSKPRVLACSCGMRRLENKPAPTNKKPLKDIKRCMALTKKGTRCRRIAGPSGYCSIPSHRPGNSAV
jgi:predicted RNA-binding Zn-ribbon protein involved in translation (DUF1610 family)